MRGDGARGTHRGQFVERDRLCSQPRGTIDLGFGGKCQLERAHIGLASCRRHIDRTGHRAFKQPAGPFEHHIGRQARLHAPEHVKHHLGRGHGLADIDRVDDIVGEIGTRLHSFLLDPIGEDHVEFGHFAVDFFLRRRVGERVCDHGSDIGERCLPVAGQWGKGYKGRIGRARDVVLLHLRIKEAAAAACARFEPAVDDRLCDSIGQQALVILDRIGHLPPRSHHRIGQAARQIGFDADRQLANRCAGHAVILRACGRNRIAEIGGDPGLAGAFPVSEPLLHQPCQHHRIGIADNHDHGVFRTIPTVIERLHVLAIGGLEGFIRANRAAGREALSGKEGLPRKVCHAQPRSAAFTLFGEHDWTFGCDIGVIQHRLADHAR